MFRKLRNLFSIAPKIVYEITVSPEGVTNGYTYLTTSIPGVVNDSLMLSELSDRIIPHRSGIIAVVSGVSNIRNTYESIQAIAEESVKFIHDPFGGKNNSTVSLLMPGNSVNRKQLIHGLFDRYFQGEATFVGLLGLTSDVATDQSTLEELSEILWRIAELKYETNEKLIDYQEKVRNNFDKYYSDQRAESLLTAGSDEQHLWFYLKSTSAEDIHCIVESVAEAYGLSTSN